MKKIVKLIFISILIYLFSIFGITNTFALTNYKECIKNNDNYDSKILCSDNYYLYYKLKSLHNLLIQVIKKYPTKIGMIKDDLVDILNNINNKDIYNTNNICKAFFKDKICDGDYYNNVRELDNDDFLKNLNLKDTLKKTIIRKDIVNDNIDDNKKIEIYEKIQNDMNSFKSGLRTFTSALGVILTKTGDFKFSNVILGANSIDLRLEALSKPNDNNNNSNIKHYKIGLLNLFRPFFLLSQDIFISLPITGRYIANPYIIFGIIWYYTMYGMIILFIIFIILSSLTFPLIEQETSKGIIRKRRNIWTLMINSSEFNFFNYLYKIFLTNEDYSFTNDETKITTIIKNKYRTPFILRVIIKEEYIGLGYMLGVWIFILFLIQGLSGYLIG